MNILFTLCGRAGSKGVRGKNARDFLDVPLAWYSLAAIAQYINVWGGDDKIYVAVNTDSPDLMDIVKRVKMPVEVDLLWRDASLGGDKVPKVAVIVDCLERAEQIHGCEFDMVVDLDITSPLRTARDVRNVVERKAKRDDVDVVYTVTHSRRNPYFNMVVADGDYFHKAIASDFTTRQDAPVMYDMNASIYAYSPKALRTKAQATFFNDRCDAVLMRDTGVLDIDSEDDYLLMQAIAQHLFATDEGYKSILEVVKGFCVSE